MKVNDGEEEEKKEGKENDLPILAGNKKRVKKAAAKRKAKPIVEIPAPREDIVFPLA